MRRGTAATLTELRDPGTASRSSEDGDANDVLVKLGVDGVLRVEVDEAWLWVDTYEEGLRWSGLAVVDSTSPSYVGESTPSSETRLDASWWRERLDDLVCPVNVRVPDAEALLVWMRGAGME
jgi:hypothetical protein